MKPTPELSRDLALTHQVVNYVCALYQGRYAGLQVLQDLSHPDFTAKDLEATAKVLGKSMKWLDDLWGGLALFSVTWPSPATFDAQKAIEFLDQIRPELEQFSKRLDTVLKTPNLADLSAPDLHFLASGYARHLYSRLHYNIGFYLYGKAFELPDTVTQYEALIKQGEGDIKAIAALTSLLKGGKSLDAAFFSGFAIECRYLPAVARCYIHDLLQITSRYRGGFNFSTGGFLPEESQEWNKRNISPLEAGHWRAYDFDPAGADSWRKVGITLHSLAAEWRDCGFTPTTATPWLSYGFPPVIAQAWSGARYEPTEALSYIQRGIRDPKQVTN